MQFDTLIYQNARKETSGETYFLWLGLENATRKKNPYSHTVWQKQWINIFKYWEKIIYDLQAPALNQGSVANDILLSFLANLVIKGFPKIKKDHTILGPFLPKLLNATVEVQV